MHIWIPGPSHVRDAILKECARPMIGHRSAAMAELHERIDPHLKLCFGLDADSHSQVAVHTTSASGMMEAALHGVGARVLVVVHGAFANRWFEIAQLLGKQASALVIPHGQAPSASDLERELTSRGPFDALAVVLNETSTGVRIPRQWLAQARRACPETLLLVDVVSYAGGGPIEFDSHGFDFAFAGSQKALALPPGLSVACASQRYLERARVRPRATWYLDPVRVFEGHKQRETPATPCIPLYYALARQLEDISSGSVVDAAPSGQPAWAARFERHVRQQRRVEHWAQPWIAARQLSYLAAPELRSPTVTNLVGQDLDLGRLQKLVEARGHKLGSGYGKLKGKAFRIGHMGDHSDQDLEQLLEHTCAALHEVTRST